LPTKVRMLGPVAILRVEIALRVDKCNVHYLFPRISCVPV
jgi:hypothetical protein